ncbi:unnamed protein product [Choristocarpus tenellus]
MEATMETGVEQEGMRKLGKGARLVHRLATSLTPLYSVAVPDDEKSALSVLQAMREGRLPPRPASPAALDGNGKEGKGLKDRREEKGALVDKECGLQRGMSLHNYVHKLKGFDVVLCANSRDDLPTKVQVRAKLKKISCTSNDDLVNVLTTLIYSTLWSLS